MRAPGYDQASACFRVRCGRVTSYVTDETGSRQSMSDSLYSIARSYTLASLLRLERKYNTWKILGILLFLFWTSHSEPLRYLHVK
jgi:hypothetical protein